MRRKHGRLAEPFRLGLDGASDAPRRIVAEGAANAIQRAWLAAPAAAPASRVKIQR